MVNPIHEISLKHPLFSCSPSAGRLSSISPILNNQISKTRIWQNCSVAKMLCFAVVSASLPCVIVPEMHAFKKKHAEPETLRGTVTLRLAIMTLRKNPENPDCERWPFFKLAPF